MKRRWFGAMLRQVLSLVLGLAFNAATAQAGENVILRFDQTRGANPSSALVEDAAGNLYGTTTLGGAANCGIVFELSPGPDGKWTETILFSFPSCTFPPGLAVGGTLVFDKQGNLYVVATNSDCCQIPGGFVFRLSKGANGMWSGAVIYRFTADDGYPYSDLTTDSAGNLYGTTYLSSSTSNGKVFKLSPQPGGKWQETILFGQWHRIPDDRGHVRPERKSLWPNLQRSLRIIPPSQRSLDVERPLQLYGRPSPT